MRKLYGMTLIEIIAVLAIIGILSSVSYKAYKTHIMKTYRTDAHTSLLATRNNIESFLLASNKPLSEIISNYATPTGSIKGYYLITVGYAISSSTYSVGSATTTTYDSRYTITATACTNTTSPCLNNTQKDDIGCQTITLAHDGTKAPSTCW